jgi:hypothetical protein
MAIKSFVSSLFPANKKLDEIQNRFKAYRKDIAVKLENNQDEIIRLNREYLAVTRLLTEKSAQLAFASQRALVAEELIKAVINTKIPGTELRNDLKKFIAVDSGLVTKVLEKLTKS